MRDELGRRLVGWSALQGGTNNRLFRLETDAGTPLLAKFHHRDRWNRLEREFGTLSVLHERENRAVPRPYLRSDDHAYAVYSFELGQVRAAADLEIERLRAAAVFAADLHRIRPADVAGDLPHAIGASFSSAEHVDAINARLRAFEEFATGSAAYDEVRALHRRLDLRGIVDAAGGWHRMPARRRELSRQGPTAKGRQGFIDLLAALGAPGVLGGLRRPD